MKTAVLGLSLSLLALISIPLSSEPQAAPSAESLLDRVDANEVYTSIQYRGEMVIEYQGRRYLKTFRVWASGRRDSFVVFDNPEDRDTRYLKKEGRLYVWSPDTEEVMLISGHLLKESMMGSDLSYEDTIENETLASRYVPTCIGTEDMDGRQTWVLDLRAKKKTESYPREKLWIDASTGDLVRMELYALSGSLLKEYRLLSSRVIGKRRFPVESEMRDLLRKDSRTVFRMTEVVLDAPISPETYSLRNLEK